MTDLRVNKNTVKRFLSAKMFPSFRRKRYKQKQKAGKKKGYFSNIKMTFCAILPWYWKYLNKLSLSIWKLTQNVPMSLMISRK